MSDQLRSAVASARTVVVKVGSSSLTGVRGGLEPERLGTDAAGQVTRRVQAEVDDTYFAQVVCASGALVQLLWSWTGHGEALNLGDWPAFYGSRGCIKGGRLVLDDGFRGPLLERFERDLDAEQREQFFPLGLREPYAILQLDWLRGLLSGEPDA